MQVQQAVIFREPQANVIVTKAANNAYLIVASGRAYPCTHTLEQAVEFVVDTFGNDALEAAHTAIASL